MLKSKNSAGIDFPCSKVNSKLFDEGTLCLWVKLFSLSGHLFIE